MLTIALHNELAEVGRTRKLAPIPPASDPIALGVCLLMTITLELLLAITGFLAHRIESGAFSNESGIVSVD